jgi:hypothetical protein
MFKISVLPDVTRRYDCLVRKVVIVVIPYLWSFVHCSIASYRSESVAWTTKEYGLESQERRRRAMGSPSYLANAYRGLFRDDKEPEHDANHRLPSASG